MRLPFNLIVDRAFQIINLIILADSLDVQMLLMEEFDLFLIKSGWNELDFDNDLLKYVDNNWLIYLN